MIATLAGNGLQMGWLAFAPVAEMATPLPPILILGLCVIAGIGTVWLLPTRMQPGLQGIGAALVITAGLILVAALIHYVGGPVVGLEAPRVGMGIYFWIFATVALVGAMRVVTHPRPVYSALYFVMTVFASAGLFVLLWAEFMAAALVLIYAGAILITYVFVIMLAAQARNPASTTIPAQVADYDAVSREPLLASAVGFVLMGVLLLVIFDRAAELPVPPAPETHTAVAGETVLGATQQLGVYLFSNQIVTLELAGLMLTVAMVGAVLIARRRVIHHDEMLGKVSVVIAPMTPVTDDPHSIPVDGTRNPRLKEYPET